MYVDEQLPPAVMELFYENGMYVEDEGTLRWLLRGLRIVGEDEVAAEVKRMIFEGVELYDDNWRKSADSSF